MDKERPSKTRVFENAYCNGVSDKCFYQNRTLSIAEFQELILTFEDEVAK